MKTLATRNGHEIVVDDSDYHLVAPHKLTVAKTPYGVPYAYIFINKKRFSLHRYILGLNIGEIDHVNGNPLDNRRSNLRIVSHQENMRNQRPHQDSCGPFKGIWWSATCQKWAAQICHKGKKFYLGLFGDPIEAARAYDRKARELFGPFARLNFPEVAA